MQNKFGFKDFVLMLLVGLVGVLVVLAMVQDDRLHKQTSRVANKVSSIEQQIARLERDLSEGVVFAPGTGSAPINASLRDESWARQDGTPVVWFGMPKFASDPRDMTDYQLGGEFKEIFEAQPAKLTPVLGEDTYGRRVQDQVCEALATLNPETQELEGMLAEAWQYDTEGNWLRVKIRERARYSDGEPVTAEDVRWTLDDYINNPELETESLRSIMTQIESVEVITDRVVEFKFTEPDAYNQQAALGFYILPKHFYTRFTPTQINQATALTVGSGPYKFENLDPNNQWTPGQEIELVRNEQYWGPKPTLEKLRFDTIQEDVSRLTSFTNGEADMINPSSPQFVQKTEEPGWEERAHSLQWVNMRSGYSFIGWQCGPRNGKLTPFHDRRVRLAMTLNLDRERMIRDIYMGIGEVAVGPNNPPSPAANPDIDPWPYDPERAVELLAEAGWKDRDGNGILENEDGIEFEFEFTRATGGQSIERIEKYIVDRCAAIGIRCTPRPVDWALYDQILKNRDFDAITLGWSATAPESDPKQIWHTDSIQNQGHNFIQWDAGQDQYIDKIKTTLDFEERMELFHQFNALVHEEQPYTFFRVAPWLRFISKDFKNVHPYPTGLEQREFYQAPMSVN